MYAIKAVYDGTDFKPREPIPVNEEYEVVITFTAPLKKTEGKPKYFSEAERDKISQSLFGVLPPDIDLDKSRTERLN
jgi:hypothetical protein